MYDWLLRLRQEQRHAPLACVFAKCTHLSHVCEIVTAPQVTAKFLETGKCEHTVRCDKTATPPRNQSHRCVTLEWIENLELTERDHYGWLGMTGSDTMCLEGSAPSGSDWSGENRSFTSLSLSL